MEFRGDATSIFVFLWQIQKVTLLDLVSKYFHLEVGNLPVIDMLRALVTVF